MCIEDSIQISPFHEKHQSAVKAIFDQQFGLDYLDSETIASFSQAPNLGFVALQASEVVGVSLVYVGTVREIATHFLKGQQWFLNYFDNDLTLALRKHSAIHPAYQNQGIGKVLIRSGMDFLTTKVDAIISTVWEESAGQSLGKILRSCGSIPTKTFHHYWTEDSIEQQYYCPICQVIPCSCSMTVYVK